MYHERSFICSDQLSHRNKTTTALNSTFSALLLFQAFVTLSVYLIWIKITKYVMTALSICKEIKFIIVHTQPLDGFQIPMQKTP
jgi:hypothetical protein